MTNDSGANRRELLEMIGRRRTTDGRELTCGVYLTQTGYEVRAEYSDGEVLRTQWAMDTQGGRIIATRWVEELGLERQEQGEGGKGEGGRAGPVKRHQ